jgi:hypothetical protein
VESVFEPFGAPGWRIGTLRHLLVALTKSGITKPPHGPNRTCVGAVFMRCSSQKCLQPIAADDSPQDGQTATRVGSSLRDGRRVSERLGYVGSPRSNLASADNRVGHVLRRGGSAPADRTNRAAPPRVMFVAFSKNMLPIVCLNFQTNGKSVREPFGITNVMPHQRKPEDSVQASWTGSPTRPPSLQAVILRELCHSGDANSVNCRSVRATAAVQASFSALRKANATISSRREWQDVTA